MRKEFEKSWPNPKYLQQIFDKYAKKYDLETFRKEILPNICLEIFDMIYDHTEKRLEAVFQPHGSNTEVHDEVNNPVYLREFSRIFFPYINKEIDAIYRFFDVNYDECLRKYHKRVDDDLKVSDLIAFEYSVEADESPIFNCDEEYESGIFYLETYRCDINTAKTEFVRRRPL